MSGVAGRIVTFYSFKGGVGRTMALTNTAFLSATNGLRVLIMDWDLEAPGVPYYFRGQFEPLDEGNLATRPGVLDMVAQWTRRVEDAGSLQEADALTETYERPDAFEPFVSVLIPPERLTQGGCLHAITAGASRGGDTKRTAYEETLAAFSWPDFFNRNAGGLLVTALRKWAQDAYDLVLVDSRTGFADVAGICTVQLPDTVALCFILNRQNLEGTAKVAAAIRRQRRGEVEIRLVPMRLSREGTSEEADAQAFARDLLRRNGQIPRDRVEQDLQKLGIRAADGVPFYETLAPFVPSDPRKDVLTLDYATLTEDLVGQAIHVHPIDPGWRDAVRRRLEPRQATLAYLAELELAEPARAREEIDALIGSANHFIDTGRKLDEDYIDALIRATFNITENVDFDTSPTSTPIDGLVELLRRLTQNHPEIWRLRLASVLERILLEDNGLATIGDEAAAIEDIDALLADASPTASIALRRAELRQRLARSQIFAGSIDEANISIDIAEALLGKVSAFALDHEEISDYSEKIRQAIVLRGDAKFQGGDAKAAAELFTKALDFINDVTTPSRARSDILLRLIRAYLQSDPRSAAQPAIQWAELNRSSPYAFGRLTDLVEAAASADDPAKVSLTLIKLLFLKDGDGTASKTTSQIGRYLGASSTSRFVIAASRLVELIPDDRIAEIREVINAVSEIWPQGGIRGSVAMLSRNMELRGAIDSLLATARDLKLIDAEMRFKSVADQITRSNRRSTGQAGDRDD